SKPAVHWCQQVVGGSVLALALPEARQAHRGPQFEGFRPLCAGYGERLLQTGFCLAAQGGLASLTRLLEQQLPLEPIQLCCVVAFASVVDHGQGLVQGQETCGGPSGVPVDVSEQAQTPRSIEPGPSDVCLGQTLS